MPTRLIATAILVVANLLLFAAPWLAVQAAAAMILIVFLPGMLIGYLLPRLTSFGDLSLLERVLFGVGLGYALATIVMLAIVYLPGGISRGLVIGLFDGLMLVLLAATWLSPQKPESIAPGMFTRSHIWFWVGLVVLTCVATFLRLPNLSYSEYQDDEVSVVWHAAEAIQGRPDALFIHDKGPAEILLTTGIYASTDRLNEGAARLPFALAGLFGLYAVWLLGWRVFGPIPGWLAAMLLALDGYFIGFSRIVQYQSVVFLMVTLVIVVAHRYHARQATSPAYLILSALFLGVGMLAHYEAAFVLVPAAYLLIRASLQPKSRLRTPRAFVTPVLILILLLAAFYVPFALHPRFARTFAEITGNRIGGGFPYNNLVDFVTRSTIYSTSYYLLLLLVAVTAALLAVYQRALRGWVRWAAGGVLLGGLALTVANPQWLHVADTELTWLFFVVALVPAFFGPRIPDSERAIWLWFGVPMLLSLFFVQKPRTHVYDFFIPWALLAGSALGLGWDQLVRSIGLRQAGWIGVPVTAALILVFGNYAYWYFVYTGTEVLRTWTTSRPLGYWTPYAEPAQNAIFGFPFKNGWKAVGVLASSGAIDGPFARNGERGIANWYTRGVGDCSRDARYYVYTPWNEPTNKGLTTERPRPSSAEGWSLEHVVLVNGEPRLEIYGRGAPTAEPQTHDIADFETRFDRYLSGPRFEPDGPAVQPRIENPLDLRFGDRIQLIGYTLPAKEVAPGQALNLTLYWQATAPITDSYKVFTQVIEMQDYRKAGQRDGIPGCERFPANSWLPGQTIVDRYSIEIAPDAMPGEYTLLVGLYDDQEERVDVYSADGKPLGDAVGLDKVTVRPDSE